MESHARSLAKSASYRVLGLLVTVLVAWALTGRWDLAGGIGAADTLLKVFVYYFHERAWSRVAFGRQAAEDYEI